jgi:sugar porter (SP) family MFS transporter
MTGRERLAIMHAKRLKEMDGQERGNPMRPAAPAATFAERGANRRYLYLITFVAAVGGFLFGYDLSLISGAIIFLQREWNLTPFWYGAVTGSAILGCPFGPLAGVWLADALGRNKTLILSALLFIASAIGCAFAHAMLDFSLWRFVGGIGVGLASTVSPMYIAEVAPARLRGRLVVINQLAIVIGLSLSVYVTYVLSFGEHWRLMFATMALPATIFLFGLFFIPRSPRWLASRGDFDEAFAVLQAINGRAQADRELAEIRQELGEESGGLRDLIRPGVRMALAIGVALMVFSQINGVNMILIYAPTLFIAAGINDASAAILNSVYLTAWITVCTVAAFWLTSRFGRRPILICGVLGMASGHVLLFLCFTYAWSTLVTLIGMFLAAGAFTLTLAPLSWVILSEIFPNRVRGKAMSLATMAMFIASYITVNLFPVILDAFKNAFGNPGGTFLIFAGICLTCSLFVWWSLPETKDKTLEEISRLWLHVNYNDM